MGAATLDMFALYMSFLFGYFVIASYDGRAIYGGLIGLATFLALQPIAAAGGTTSNLGSTGLLEALFAGLAGPTLFHYLSQVKVFEISMPANVPPAVSRSFSALIPFTLTLLTFALIQPV